MHTCKAVLLYITLRQHVAVTFVANFKVSFNKNVTNTQQSLLKDV